MSEPTITRAKRGDRIVHVVRVRVEGGREHLGTFRREEDALARAEAYRIEARAKAPTSATLTVDGWVSSWLTELKDDQKRVYRSHLATYKAYLRGSKLAGMGLRSVRTEHVREWMHALKRRVATRGKNAEKRDEHGRVIVAGKRLGESTLHNALTLVSAAFRDAVEAGKMRDNPARGIRIAAQARTQEPWHYLTLAEITKVFATPAIDTARRRSQGIRAAIATAIYTGMREGELWGLRWEDVHLEGDAHVVVRYSYDGPTKGGIVRTVPLFPSAVTALKAWREHKGARKLKGLVWPGRRLARRAGEQHHGRGYDAGWPEIRALAGVRDEVVFHDLRHTYASHLVSGSWGRAWRLEEIQKLMGHKDLKTTMRYAHLAPEAIRGAMIEARAMWSVGDGSTDGSPAPKSPSKKPRK